MSFSVNLIEDLEQMFHYSFMQHAFEAGTVIAIVAGIVGYFVVLRDSAFAAHALSHIGFAGAAGAVLFAVNPIYGLFIFTGAGGLGMAVLSPKASHRDVQIGTVLAFMLGLGLLFINIYKGNNATGVYSILFGEILGISSRDVTITFVSAVVILAAVAFVYRRLLFASLDEDVAEARGMSMLLMGIIFMLLVAAATSISIQVVGVLLIFSLLVTPAAIAQRIATRPSRALAIAIAVALMATWLGLFVSFYSPYPVSFFITAIVFVSYLLVRFVGPRVSKERTINIQNAR